MTKKQLTHFKLERIFWFIGIYLFPLLKLTTENKDRPCGLVWFSCMLCFCEEETWKSLCLISLRVCLHDFLDPVEVFTHFDVDAGVVGKGTSLTPGHQSVDFSETHQRAPGVSLSTTGKECELVHTDSYSFTCRGTDIACVSSSIHVSGTHHPACDHVRIGIFTVLVTHYGDVQALQISGHHRWKTDRNSLVYSFTPVAVQTQSSEASIQPGFLSYQVVSAFTWDPTFPGY